MNNKILICLGHPAHFHLYKYIINNLITKGFSIKIIISDKDILKDLLDKTDYDYSILYKRKKEESLRSKFLRIFFSYFDLYQIVKSYQPKLIIGCLTQIGFISFISRIPSIFNAEDDINYTLFQALITYPFISTIVTPTSTNVSVFKYKRIGYSGFHKLAYLHPNQFIPDRSKVKIPENEKFFILRFISLTAYHDVNAQGISNPIANKLISILSKHGKVIITNERELPPELEKYRFNGNISDIHHYLYYANLYIGDSQSMAVEAAMLGTPGIRFNNFVGKISVLKELENDYFLSYGIRASNSELLFSTVDKILTDENISEKWENRRKKLLDQKIDTTAFLTWLIINYPKSIEILKKNPNYQNNFK